MRCLLIDDEPLAIDLLENYIQNVPFLTLAGKCYDGMEALSFLQNNEADLIFLDINMPQLTGMELANILPKNTKIIFTTAYSEFAVESYEKNAIDYLLKPIRFERFLQAVLKARAASVITSEKPVITTAATLDNEYPPMFVKSGKQMIRIDFQEVDYLEGAKDYVIFHQGKQRTLVHTRMKELEKALPPFIQRVHLSYFVNIYKINKIEDNQAFINNISIPISGKYKEAFFAKISAITL
ncbi:MAG: LytR/AlgR family response regulator transcription factor [Saprospiraceae bacterium]